MASNPSDVIISAVMGLLGGLLSIPISAYVNSQTKKEELLIQHKNNLIEKRHELLLQHLLEDKELQNSLLSNNPDSYQKFIEQLDLLLDQNITSNSRKGIRRIGLNNTISGREVLKLYEKPYEFVPNFFEPYPIKNDTSIVLWGPRYSGKSCLLRAFSASLFKHNSDDVVYSLKDEQGEIISPFLDFRREPATNNVDSKLISFSRRFNKSFAYGKTNSKKHTIKIWDLPGEAATNSLIDEAYNFFDYKIDDLRKSDCILLTLDHTLIDNKRATTYFGKDQYFALVGKLFSIINLKPKGKNIKIAICLTKIDLIEDGYKTKPWDLLYKLFGTELFQLVKEQPNTEVFSTSAYGFVNENKTIPNVSEDNQLIDQKKWEPFGVEYPFFWMFNSVEYESINRNFYEMIARKLLGQSFLPYPTVI